SSGDDDTAVATAGSGSDGQQGRSTTERGIQPTTIANTTNDTPPPAQPAATPSPTQEPGITPLLSVLGSTEKPTPATPEAMVEEPPPYITTHNVFVRPGSNVAGAMGTGVVDDDNRSQRGSTGDHWSESRSHDGGAPGGGSYGGHPGMPRNFRIGVDGYTLMRDEDG
ncbi:unnamed protein product, partial [Sphacelaria rigidula]